MNGSRRRIEFEVIAIALVLDLVLGWLFAVAERIPVWHGIYCGLANAVTLGGDISPTNGWAYAINAAECVLVVPLFAAAISLFSSIVTTKDLKVHINRKHDQLKDHISAARDNQDHRYEDKEDTAPPPPGD